MVAVRTAVVRSRGDEWRGSGNDQSICRSCDRLRGMDGRTPLKNWLHLRTISRDLLCRVSPELASADLRGAQKFEGAGRTADIVTLTRTEGPGCKHQMIHNLGHRACSITLSASEKTVIGTSSPIAMAAENKD
jgi:hypothetical protein